MTVAARLVPALFPGSLLPIRNAARSQALPTEATPGTEIVCSILSRSIRVSEKAIGVRVQALPCRSSAMEGTEK